MHETLEALKAKLSACDCHEECAKILVVGVADALDALTQDPVAIKALAADLRAGANELAAACVENCSGDEEETTTFPKKTAPPAPSTAPTKLQHEPKSQHKR